MMDQPRNSTPFYVSVSLYIAYIFIVNWSSSAEKMGNVWQYDTLSILSNIVLIACCMLIVYKIGRDFSYYVKNVWFTLASVAILIFLAVSINSISIVLPLILGFSGINGQDKAIAKTAVRSFSVFLIISCTLCFLGLTGGDSVSKPLFGGDTYYATTMSALGLSNPNAVMLIFVNIIALSLCLCRTKKQSLYVSIVLLILTIALASITGSTTGFMIGIAAILLMYAARYYKRIANIFTKVTPWAFLVATVISFAIGITFGARDSIPNPVNDALTTRPYMWNLRIENSSYLNVYGNSDEYQADSAPNGSTYSLDNMFLYMLVHYGVVVYLIFFYIFYSGSKKITNPTILVYILIVCALMFVERMYLYSIVLVFLQKNITEHYLVDSNTERNT